MAADYAAIGAQGDATGAIMFGWLRRWRERDDRRLIKGAVPPADVDPIEELARIVGEAQERDADDERRFDDLMRGDRPSSYQRRRPNRR